MWHNGPQLDLTLAVFPSIPLLLPLFYLLVFVSEKDLPPLFVIFILDDFSIYLPPSTLSLFFALYVLIFKKKMKIEQTFKNINENLINNPFYVLSLSLHFKTWY